MKAKAPVRWFKLEGSSFTISSAEDRDLLLNDFTSLVASTKSGVLLMRRERQRFTYYGYEADVIMVDFYLRTTAESVPYFNAKPVDAVPRPNVSRLVDPYTLLLDSNMYARVLVAYRFPSRLPEGFLYSLFNDVGEIVLIYRVVGRSKALSTVERARKRKVSGSSGSVELQEQVAMLEELARSVLSGADLLEVYLMLTLLARDLRELNGVEGQVKTLLKGFGVEAEAPPMQRRLYDFSVCSYVFCLEKAYTDTYSLKPLFFMIDEELVDGGGVFLGVSGTGSPVVLNPWTKPNLNFVILGVTGSGKSMTAKVFLKRLRELCRDVPYVGIDPESEYTKVSRLLGAAPVEIGERGELGLDPIKMLQLGYLDVSQVADVLSEVYVVPEQLQGLLRRELSTKADRVDDVEELVTSMQDPQLSRYLQGALAEPDVHVYRGEPPNISSSTVFGLKNVRSKRLKILISALIAAYAYNRLLTRSQKSVFFVDEAWLFMETPSIVALFENIARRGRKCGVVFMYVSQRAEDLARTPQGRTVLEQSATSLILRQELEGRDAVREIYKLSDAEADFLVNAPTGAGILKAGRKRLTLQVLPTEEELKSFTTSIT
ncbi:MAG: DUF87 domain-containing protein [Zestosphaera sp.]